MATTDNEEVYGLFANDIRRIERTVKRVENMALNNANGRGNSPVAYDNGFYAKITALDPASNAYKYSWERIYFDRTTDTLATFTNPRESARYDDADDHYAVEKDKSKVVPIGSYVWLYNPVEAPYFFFDYGNPTFWFKVGASNITAADYDTNPPSIGNGNAYLYKVSSNTLVPDDKHTTTLKIYNPSATEIDANKFVRCQHCKGLWVVVWEDCD